MVKPALAADNPTFQMKGSLFPLSVLYLMDRDLARFAEQLAERVEMAPNFFRNNPIIVDLAQLPEGGVDIDFKALYAEIRRFNMVPLGLRGGSEYDKEQAARAGFNLLNDAKPGAERKAAEPPAPPPRPAVNPTVIVDQPVRSGHQIYARAADLIVMAPVNPGAEILADGNIHVYAQLRGRALAGVAGNTQARIFCDSLEAELISIAGRYQLSEDLPASTQRKRVAIRLVEDKLNYDVLGN